MSRAEEVKKLAIQETQELFQVENQFEYVNRMMCKNCGEEFPEYYLAKEHLGDNLEYDCEP